MIHVKTHFTNFERQSFGPLFALFMGLVAGMIVRHFGTPRLALLLTLLSGLLIVVFYAVPQWQVRIYRGWLLSLAPIGVVGSYLVLALIYWTVLTPIGLALRLGGHEPLRITRQLGAQTYWVERKVERASSDYFRQY